jgi:hypothetical protein
MAHSIAGVVLGGEVSRPRAAKFDTDVIRLEQGFSLMWMDHFYSEYWQSQLDSDGLLVVPSRVVGNGLLPILPRERAVLRIVRCLTDRRPAEFVILRTEYFGGAGSQLGVAFRGEDAFDTDGSINDALRAIGVRAEEGVDEFDTLGLGDHRSIPDSLLDRWQSYPEPS